MRILKTILTLILAVVLCALSVFSISADAIYYADGCSYTFINNDRVSITGWEGEGTILRVPATLNGRSVTNIARRAFLDDSTITGIDFSEAINLTTIGMYAFSNCSAFSEPLIFPPSITTIGDCAFEGSSVSTVEFNSSADYVPAQCFYDCSSLTEVKINDAVTEIGTYAFANCPNLTAVYLPDTVTTIPNSAFKNDPNLTIYCYADSYAQQYAEARDIPYVLIQTYEVGDVDRDGTLSITDVTLIQKYLAELEMFDDEQLRLADFSADGQVDIADATAIQITIAE